MVANSDVNRKIGSQSGDPVLGEKIRQLRKERMQCDQKTFASLLGVSQAIISQWESGKYMPSSMALLAIARLAGPEAEWWTEQAGPEYADSLKTVRTYKDTYTVENDDNQVIQIHRSAGKGPNRVPPEDAEARISLPGAWLEGCRRVVGLKVVGNTGLPKIADGYVALVDIHDHSNLKALEGKLVAERDDSGVRVKRVLRIGEGYFLVPANPGDPAPPLELHPGDHAIVGRVVRWIGEAD